MNKKSDNCSDCVHAEVDCVERLKKSEKKTSINLIVFRTNNKGDKLMMAKPCENCMRVIDFTLKKKNYKLKKIIYTNEDGDFVNI
tara:strand:+ start:19648 stop:19902 length:255 start_codon:yes stop_codon:yes gene_type:complete